MRSEGGKPEAKKRFDEIDRWDELFKRLNRLPTKGLRRTFGIIEAVDRKQRDNYVKQIKNKLEEKKTKTENKLRMDSV